MEQIHNLLIPQLLEFCTQKPEVVPVKNPKINIFIDEKKGIYRETEKGILAYKIKTSSKRFHVIITLFGKDRVKTSLLAQATNQTEAVLRKEIDKTNYLFAVNLKFQTPLILKLGTGGVCLNWDRLNIVRN